MLRHKELVSDEGDTPKCQHQQMFHIDLEFRDFQENENRSRIHLIGIVFVLNTFEFTTSICDCFSNALKKCKDMNVSSCTLLWG